MTGVSDERMVQILSELVAICWPHVTEETLSDVVVQAVMGDRDQLWEGIDTLPYAKDPMCQRLISTLGPMTLEEIGACFGITRERVRQIVEARCRRWKRLTSEESWFRRVRS